MGRTSIGQAILIVAMLSGLIFAAADPLSTIPPGVERYARAMAAVMKSSGPISLEPVFAVGMSAATTLVRDQLERFDEPTYQKVQSMMVGFYVGRVEVIVVEPDANFFLKLARAKGTSVDRAFFDAQKKTYPDGYWPAYNDRQTDYSGCTIFDGKTLTKIYGAWIAFQAAYPDRYREATQKELEKIEQALLGNCTCGGEADVQKELENFLKAFPNSPLAAKVASHLQAVKSRTSGFRFYCKTG